MSGRLTKHTSDLNFADRWVAATVALSALTVAEFATMWVGYQSSFFTGFDSIHLLVAGVATACVLAFVVAILWYVGNLVVSSFPGSRPLCLVPAFLVFLSLAAMVNTGGSMVSFGGAKNLIALGVGLGLAAFGWLLTSRLSTKSIAIMNRSLLGGVALGCWFASGYYVDYVCGKLGFGSDLLKPLTVTAFVCASFAMPIGVGIWRFFSERGYHKIITATVVVVQVGLYVFNSRKYVDDYGDLHLWLFVIAVVSLIATLLLWRPVFDIPEPKPKWIVVALVMSAVLSWSAQPDSNVGYVASLHTTYHRYQREIVHEVVAGPQTWFGDRLQKIERRKKLACGEILPIEPGETPGRMVVPKYTTTTPLVKNAIVFLLDMKRPKDIGLYVEGPSRTPKIDSCFSNAIRFNNAYSAGASTSVSFPAIYTGSYEPAKQFDERRLTRPAWFTHGKNLPTTFAEAGFETVVISNRWYEREFFTDLSEQKIYDGFTRQIFEGKTKGKSSTDRLAQVYEKEGGIIPELGPFITIVHLVSHGLHELPEVDSFVGEVCAELKNEGRLSETALILTSDHGVAFREHGRTTYGHTTFDEEILVPLLIQLPSTKSKSIETNVSLTDLFPTLLDVTGVRAPIQMDGRSLLPVLIGEDFPDRPVFSFTHHPDLSSVAVVDGKYKYMRWQNGVEALFDLGQDPGETRNLIDTPEQSKNVGHLRRLVDAVH